LYIALARRKREPCSASPTLVQALYATRALVRRAHNSLDHQGIFWAAGFFFTLGIFADLAHVAIEEAIWSAYSSMAKCVTRESALAHRLISLFSLVSKSLWSKTSKGGTRFF
jgi:hypothetical protein